MEEALTTKEKILSESLLLFAKEGFEAVSVSDIAEKLGITKGALYKHYKNKRDIFDKIVARMEKIDFERANEFRVPEGTLAQMPEKYKNTTLGDIAAYTVAQFRFWTEDKFACAFRQMLTLEQYKSPEMAQLYSQYLSLGPLGYIEDIFSEMSKNATDAKALATEFYSPFFFLLSVFDTQNGRPTALEMLEEHVCRFMKKYDI